MTRAPAVFVAHGAPTIALEQDGFTETLRRFGREHPRPLAIAVISAHWQAPVPVRVTAAERPPLLFDFGGFPDALYALNYPCPGDPVLAREIAALLHAEGLEAALDPKRGFDHGVWVPLRFMYPRADLPVVQVSLPLGAMPKDLLRLGMALAPLRDRGVLLLGTGGVVHNLRRVRMDDKDAPVDPWASEFDAWVRDRLQRRDVEGLMAYRTDAPQAVLAVPESEHIDPLFVVLGAASSEDRVVPLYEGFHHGNLSLRSVALEP